MRQTWWKILFLLKIEEAERIFHRRLWWNFKCIKFLTATPGANNEERKDLEVLMLDSFEDEND